VENIKLVTIGITNYNYGRYLKQCLDSMLGQTYPNIEIIVDDDASTDESVAVIASYGNQIKSIIHEDNSGGAKRGFLELLKRANGDYYMHYDADDWLEPDAIELMLGEFQKDATLDFVYSGSSVHFEDGRATEEWSARYVPPTVAIAQMYHNGGSAVITTKGLYRTKFIRKCGYVTYMGSEVDTLSLLNNLRNGMCYRCVGSNLRHYRVHGGSDSHNVEMYILSINAILNYIVDHFGEREYLPEIQWDKQVDNYAKVKALMVANHFHRYGEHYANGHYPQYLKNNATREEMARFAEPLFLSAKRYYKKCMEEK
jgi:glycosyltransferase involved in cell wall biosynthesis